MAGVVWAATVPAAEASNSAGNAGRSRLCMREISPARAAVSRATVQSFDRYRMPAELVAQRRDHLGTERLLLAGAESRDQRQGDDGGRYVESQRFVDCPASLPRVLNVAVNGVELVVARSRSLRQ